MTFSKVLVKTQKFELKTEHLIIIGVLCLAFVISFLIRSEPIGYGFQLNEFDPFFNFRATQFLVDNGLEEYLNWNDDKSWYPNGRDVSATSQFMLHATTAFFYEIFGGNGSLYSFTIMFPVVIGSLTVFVVFALVRVLAGTSAGLFSALFFAVAPSIIVRGTAGWFKSEPLGLFYGLLGLFLFLNAIKSKNHKISIIKLIGGGLFISFGLASWGGIQFLIIPLGMFFFAIPFLRSDTKFVSWAFPLFTASVILFTSLFERPGISFAFGLGGISLIVPTAFIIISNFIQSKSSSSTKKRNMLIFLIGIIIASIAFLVVNAETEVVKLPAYRYLNAINPFLTTTDPLVDSVSEHAANSINQSFFFLSFLLILSGIGVWFIFNNLIKDKTDLDKDMSVFLLIFGFIGVYASSAFIRLELFSAISAIVLSAVALSLFVKSFSTQKSKSNKILTVSFIAVITFFIASPLIFPSAPNWSNVSNVPPTILNGGTKYAVTSNDWLDTLTWIKENTPTSAKIVSWWDYGYWIETMGDRTSFIDNATIDSGAIENIAQIFFSDPDTAWKKLKNMNADYVLVFVSGQKLNTQNPIPLYMLDGGGEESKKQWILRISREGESKYLYEDGMTAKDEFWNNTLLGKLIPYSVVTYTNFQTQSDTYKPGMIPIYAKNMKYPEDVNNPFRLVYSSPSFDNPTPIVTGVFVYEINPNYVP